MRAQCGGLGGSASGGGITGLAVLGVVVAVLRPAVSAIPLDGLRLFVGGLLLVFGLQCATQGHPSRQGNKAVHDEAQIFAAELATARAASAHQRALVGDWYAVTLSFKGVVLEGLKVVFITLTFGSNQHNIALAAVAAAAVAAGGLAVRAPLSMAM